VWIAILSQEIIHVNLKGFIECFQVRLNSWANSGGLQHFAVHIWSFWQLDKKICFLFSVWFSLMAILLPLISVMLIIECIFLHEITDFIENGVSKTRNLVSLCLTNWGMKTFLLVPMPVTIPAEIQTEHLFSMSQEKFHYLNSFRKSGLFCSVS
jgi:hypothetical protein